MREEIPFIRAIRHVPDVMKSKLPIQYIEALDTQVVFASVYWFTADHQ